MAVIVFKDAVYAGHDAPVVRMAADDECESVQMSWGFVLYQTEEVSRRVTKT